MFRAIQERVLLYRKKKPPLVLAIDETQYLSPAVTYGAANEIVSTQNHLVAQFASADLNEINNNASSVLKVQSESNNTSTNLGTLSVRGSNQVDFMVPGQRSVKFNSVSLQSGSSIRVLIGADNTSDKFEVRVLDSNGYGSKLISDSGSVNGTIDIDTAGNTFWLSHFPFNYSKTPVQNPRTGVCHPHFAIFSLIKHSRKKHDFSSFSASNPPYPVVSLTYFFKYHKCHPNDCLHLW